MSAPEKKKESFATTLSDLKNIDTSDRRSDTIQELQADWERRLELLGPSTGLSTSSSKVNPRNLETHQKTEENSMRIGGERENSANPSSLSSQRPAIVMNKNILLARIMAAQERAKEAQQQRATHESSTPAQQLLQAKIEDMPISQNDSSSDLKTDTDIVNETSMETNQSISTSKVDTLGAGIINNFSQTIISYNHDEDTTDPYSQESSFYVPLEDEEKLKQIVPTPSAPPLTSVDVDEHDTLTSPSTVPLQLIPVPLSYAQASNDQQEVIDSLPDIDIDSIEFDTDGRLLSAEEKLKLIEEQRLIYDRIWHEKQLNDAAIAAAHADAFDERVNVSTSGSAISTPLLPEQSTGSVTDSSLSEIARGTLSASDVKAPTLVDIGGGKQVSLFGTERTLDAIKEGTAILVLCVSCEEWMQLTNSATLMYCPKCKVISEVIRQSAVKTKEEALRLTLDRKMAREMQERENQLIRSSTANPEARTEDHSLDDKETNYTSFVPSFITRIFYHENDDLSRPLATAQHEATPDVEEVHRQNTSEESTSSSWSSYPGSRHQLNQSSNAATSTVESRYLEDMSLWNYFSSMLSMGSSPQNSSTHRSAEIAVSRPPSSFLPSRQMANESSSGQERSHDDPNDTNDECERLIQRTEPSTSHENANIWNAPTARVGDLQPILSCVVDSISHTAIALGSVIKSRHVDADSIDRTSLLVHGQTPRITDDESSDTEGSYHRIPDH